MTTLVQPRRTRNLRRHSGAAGAYAGQLSGELFGNEADTGGLIVYWGAGDDGAGNSTSQIPIGGPGVLGAFATLSTTQTISGAKSFSAELQGLTRVAAASGSTDTSAWASFLDGTASPRPTNFLTRMSAAIDISFPAVVGINTAYDTSAALNGTTLRHALGRSSRKRELGRPGDLRHRHSGRDHHHGGVRRGPDAVGGGDRDERGRDRHHPAACGVHGS